MRSRLTALALAVAAAALLASGCGGGDDEDSGAASARLAGFAPADASFYAEAAVRPDGDLKDTVDSILDRFPDGDQVGERLVAQVDESLREDDLSYSEDIEPWLGQSAAIFAGPDARFETDESVVVLLETADESQAVDTVRKAAERDGQVRESSYKGVSYLSPTGQSSAAADQIGAAGAVDDVLILAGSEQSFKDTVDTHQGGETLNGNSDWEDFLGEQQGDPLALAYVDLKVLLDAAKKSGDLPAGELGPFQRALDSIGDQPILAAFDIEESRGTLEFSSGNVEVDDAAVDQSSLLQQIPDDAWAGIGLGSIGQYVDSVVSQLRSVQAAQFNQVESVLRRQLGIEFADLTGLGDAAAFAAGTSVFELQVGFVVEAPDAARRERLLSAIERGIRRSGEARIAPLQLSGAEGFAVSVPDLPATINFAAGDDRIVIALGDSTTEDLLEGGGDSSAVSDAAGVLGDGFGVNLFVNVVPIISLAENSAGDDPEFKQAKPYLEQFETLAIGSRRVGERDVQRIVIELTE